MGITVTMTHFFSRLPKPYCEQGTIYELYTCNQGQTEQVRRLMTADRPFHHVLRTTLQLPEEDSEKLTLDASMAKVSERGFFRTNMDIFFVHQKESLLRAKDVIQNTQHARQAQEIHAYGLLAHLRVWYDQVIAGWKNMDMDFMWKSTDITIEEYEKKWSEAYRMLVPAVVSQKGNFYNRASVQTHLQRFCATKELRRPVKEALCKIKPAEITTLAELGVLMWLVWYHDEAEMFIQVFGTSIPLATASYFAHVPLVSMMSPEQLQNFMTIDGIKHWIEAEVRAGHWAEPDQLVARMEEHNAYRREAMKGWFTSMGMDLKELAAKWQISSHEAFNYMKPYLQKTLAGFNVDVDEVIESVAALITTENVNTITEHYVAETLKVVEEHNLNDTLYYGKYADITRFQMKMMVKCMSYLFKTVVKPDFQVPMLEEPALKVVAKMMDTVVDSLEPSYQIHDMIAKAIVFVMNFRLFMGMNSFYLTAQAHPGEYRGDHEVCAAKLIEHLELIGVNTDNVTTRLAIDAITRYIDFKYDTIIILSEADRQTLTKVTTSQVNDTKPTEEHTKPIEEHTKPIAEHTKPIAEHTKPTAEHTKPTEGQTKPTEGHTKPTGGNTESTVGKTKPTVVNTKHTEEGKILKDSSDHHSASSSSSE